MEKSQFTLKQLLIVCFMLSIITPVFLTVHIDLRTRSQQTRCKGNLDQLGKVMKVYLLDFGRNVLYPQRNGQGFLTLLYHEELLTEANAYICPGTSDTNDSGRDLQATDVGDGDGPCSYAGRKNAIQQKYPGIFRPQGCGVSTLASDDWNDNQEQNHENGQVMIFLFIDGHSDHLRSTGADFANYAKTFDPLTN